MPKLLEPIKLKRETELRDAFLKQVEHIPNGEKIKNCIQCGTCTGTCPVSNWMDITPRETVAMFRAGMVEEILQSRTIWICASCYSCRVRCPSGVLVTDLLYALKRLAIDRKIFPSNYPVYALSGAFIDNVYKYGRNFELGLGLKYFLSTHPTKLLASAPFGLAMMRRGRMAIRPTKIKRIGEVRAIIDRAKQLEGA
jgi:quinone-modifying oxidoreductase, subunit QmoC